MALLVAVMAYRALRSSLPRHPLAVVFLAGALGISMFGNTELMLKAMAATVDSFLWLCCTNPAPRTVSLGT